MKLKKSHIFFICYYAAAIIGNVLAAFLLRDHWNFNAWSAFPISCFIVSLFFAWFCGSGRAQDLSDKHELFKAEWNIRKSFMPSKYAYPLYHHICITYLIVAPLFLPFIVFLPGATKAFLSVSIFMLGFFAYLIYHIWGYLAKEEKERKTKEDKLKKEQQQREELGNWK